MRVVERKPLLLVLFSLLFAGQFVHILINHCEKLSDFDDYALNFTDCTTGPNIVQQTRMVSSIEALTYDYSVTVECLQEPLKPQYRGGIISNPDFSHGLRGWSGFGTGKIESKTSQGNNTFAVAYSRNQSHDSVSQTVYLQKGMLYTLSAWLQVSERNAPVTAVIKREGDFIHAGTIIAESGCWSMLKGGLTVNSTGPAQIYFESENTGVEIWADSVSLQPFTEEEWRSHQEQSTEKERKRRVRLQAIDAQGNRLAGAKISFTQNTPGFPIGSAMDKQILTNTAYQNWFTSRFTVTTFENELKWYSTENSPGKEDYSTADAMLQFAKQHGIQVRGHNIFWDDQSMQPWWLKSLTREQLKIAVEKRITNVVQKYAGQLIHWDVVNENLHFSYFEDMIAKDFSGYMYKRAYQLDPRTCMFLNEFNTLEETGDRKASPTMYLQKLRQIQSVPGSNGPKGIGLEAHFKTPNIPYVRAAIDTLAAAGLPIWLTELDIQNTPPNQAKYLEEIMREAHSHPAVQGIVLWTAWHPEGCYRMCLTDNNFKNLPTGDVVDRLLNEWTHKNLMVTTDDNGFFETSLFHGDYEVTITHPSGNSTLSQSLKVTSTTETPEETTRYFQFSE